MNFTFTEISQVQKCRMEPGERQPSHLLPWYINAWMVNTVPQLQANKVTFCSGLLVGWPSPFRHGQILLIITKSPKSNVGEVQRLSTPLLLLTEVQNGVWEILWLKLNISKPRVAARCCRHEHLLTWLICHVQETKAEAASEESWERLLRFWSHSGRHQQQKDLVHSRDLEDLGPKLRFEIRALDRLIDWWPMRVSKKNV